MKNMQMHKTVSPLVKSLALLSGFCLAGAASAATIQVLPNSNYFNVWQFNTSTSPSTGCGSENTPATTTFTGALGGSTFQLVADAAPAPEQWQNCPSWTFGGGMPVNISAPARVSAVNIRRGITQYTFNQALPVGSTLFVQDVDAQETMVISFLSCSNAALDASGYDLLRVSNPTATFPLVTPGATWQASPTATNSNNEVFGIVIRDSNVCGVRMVNTAGGNSGGALSFLGLPPAAPIPVPDTGSTEVDVPVTIDVRANDTTTQPGTVNLAPPTITQPPVNGTVTIDGSGNAVYTPNASFVGTDAFTYQVCTQYAVPVCEVATVTVTVQAKPIVVQPTATPVPANSLWALLLAFVGLLGLTLRRSRQ